jgi:hypothetical protein
MSTFHPTEQSDQLQAALDKHAKAVCNWFEASKARDTAGRRAAAQAIGDSSRDCLDLGIDPYVGG